MTLDNLKKTFSVIALALLCYLPAYAAEDKLSYKDVFAIEYAANPVMMPDGKTVLYERRSMDMMTDSMRINLWTVNLDGTDHLPLLSGKASHRAASFSQNGKKMAYLSSKEGKTQIYVRHMESGKTARVTDVQMGPSGLSFSPDGKWIAFSMFTPTASKKLFSIPFRPKGAEWAKEATYIDSTLFQRDGSGMRRPGNMQIYIVPADGGTPRQITKGAFDHGGRMAWSPEGDSLFISANRRPDNDMDIFNSDIYRLSIIDGSLTQLTSTSGPEGSPTLSPDGTMIAFTGFIDNGKSNQNSTLYVMSVDGSDVRELTPEVDRAIGDIQWAANGAGLYFSYDTYGKKNVGYVTLQGVSSVKTDALGGQSIGRPYTSGQYDATDDGRIIFTQSTGDRPADLAIVDRLGRVTQLTDLNSDVFAHKKINKPEIMPITSSHDGRDLLAWIVKPANFDPSKKYPLILEIHGGPHTAYGPEFSTEVQLFAAAGYVVVYGNPRGSTSMGSEFANLIDKNYPSEDYNDLMDMVDNVVAKGYVDEANMFVTGGSGGGVLTAWIIGKTDRFKAAVVAKPVINWISMVGTSDIYTFMTRYWFTKTPWEDVDQYWRRSPLSLVGNVKTPTMVLTGELDVRTPMSESEQYYGALRIQGVESALVRIQGAYHGIARRPSNLVRKVGNIIAWFDKYKDKEAE
ncbi:S9 family peptidase [Temperatibacter marinus]|uniref:S9 family peptidase n=1 Tax=Temperatibacter marinus TaxID=1456591 RepID=A0AA52HA81_9PROT|nr:S9 family peptidase [Temperatibacter marinus]WND03352.1 S9 family peptidase [Temperatibacter marinus]